MEHGCTVHNIGNHTGLLLRNWLGHRIPAHSIETLPLIVHKDCSDDIGPLPERNWRDRRILERASKWNFVLPGYFYEQTDWRVA